MAPIADLIDAALTGASPAYREGAMSADEMMAQQELRRQQVQRSQLLNQQLQGQLEELGRIRAERAAAPGAVQRVVSAFQPQPGSIDRSGALDLNENPEAASTPAPVSPGRPAARTVPELFTRGVTPADYTLAETYQPKAVAGLGLMTPEAAEQTALQTRKSAIANTQAERVNALQAQLDSLDPNAPDYAANARALATRLAIAKGDIQHLLAPEGETVDLERGVKLVTMLDSNGLRRTRTVPLTESDKVALHTDRMVALKRKQEGGEPLTPEEQQQYTDSWRFVNTVRPAQLLPGGYNVPRGPFGQSPTDTVGAAVPTNGGPQGAYRGVPPVTTEGEAEKVGQRNAIIKEMEDAANIGERMGQLQDATGRASLRVRSWLQGHTPFEALSSEEQRWVTMHDRLRMFFEAATMGLGPFRSPEMQRQLQEVIGRYWTAGTAVRLRTLADTLRTQAEETATAQTAGGRRALPTPAPRSAMPAPAPTAAAPSPTSRIRVIGPNGEKGTVPASTALPPGWKAAQ